MPLADEAGAGDGDGGHGERSRFGRRRSSRHVGVGRILARHIMPNEKTIEARLLGPISPWQRRRSSTGADIDKSSVYREDKQCRFILLVGVC
jgi:hypothetical protein